MSGLRWPHRATPRQVQSIADKEVLLWEMRQHEHRDAEAARPDGLPADTARFVLRQPDRLGFHYWSDAIVAELTRMMGSKTDSDASPDASSGFLEGPSSFVEHRANMPASKGSTANRPRRWFHRRAGP